MLWQYRAVVDAQLEERLLWTLEVRSSNPVIGKIYIQRFLSTIFEKTKIKKKRGCEWPIFLNKSFSHPRGQCFKTFLV